jgi:TonB family protein
MRSDALHIPLLASFAIHILMLVLCSMILHSKSQRQWNFVPIDLVEIAPPENRENPPRQKTTEAPPEVNKPAVPAPPKTGKMKQELMAKAPISKPMAPAAIREEPARAEPQQTAPSIMEPPPSFSSGARSEGGGSEAGAGNLYGGGDVGVVPGTGTTGGGGGTAASGLGRGAGAPGLPAEPVLKTSREAKALQTVRAVYPSIALRMGLESDVTLRIVVDPDGNVTRAEIIKSGGAGFDDEALKAVKQSHFEAAQRDGQNVAAEFTYIYRFRLRR